MDKKHFQHWHLADTYHLCYTVAWHPRTKNILDIGIWTGTPKDWNIIITMPEQRYSLCWTIRLNQFVAAPCVLSDEELYSEL